MSEAEKVANKDGNERNWSSALKKGRERFLAHVIDQGLEIGQRTPEDFLRHFPPMDLMEALRDQPALRAEIIVFTTGTKQRIAQKKSWKSCGEDLRIALDEGETDAQSVLDMLDLDDRVRFLDSKKLWTYVTESKFWNVAPANTKDLELARSHVTFMLERALSDQLLTHADIVEGITLEELATRLPKSELGNIIKLSLENSRANKAFTERDLLTAVPPSVLVNYVPLGTLWNQVVVPRIAERHGYAPRPEETAADPDKNDAAPAEAEAKSSPDSSSAERRRARRSTGALDSSTANPAPQAQASSAAKGSPEAATKSETGEEGLPATVAKQGENAAEPSSVALKPPTEDKAPAKTVDTASWFSEIDEADLLEEDELAEVANS